MSLHWLIVAQLGANESESESKRVSLASSEMIDLSHLALLLAEVIRKCARSLALSTHSLNSLSRSLGGGL